VPEHGMKKAVIATDSKKSQQDRWTLKPPARLWCA